MSLCITNKSIEKKKIKRMFYIKIKYRWYSKIILTLPAIWVFFDEALPKLNFLKLNIILLCSILFRNYIVTQYFTAVNHY